MYDLARFFALSADPIAISSLREGVLKRVNPAMCHLLGWSEAELLSRPSLEFVHPDDIPAAQAARAKVAAGEHSVRSEFRLRCKDGSFRLIEWHCRYYPEEDEQYASGRDVTARRAAEAARASAQAELTEVLESIGDAFYSLDAEWRFTYINAHAAKLLNQAPETLLGRSVWDVVPSDRDDLAPIARALQQTMADRQPRDLEFMISASRRWVLSRLYPRSDGGLSSFFQDITERKRMEEALRASEAHFEAVANLGPDLLWRHDPDGTVTWYNERWRSYAGQSPMAIEGRGRGLVHPDDITKTSHILNTAWENRQPATYEHRMRRCDGAYRWFLMRVQPVFDGEGRVTDWFGAATDIDDLKHLQGQQQLLVAELQHRTRNLIAVVRSVAKQILESSASLDDFAERFNNRLGALSRVQGFLSQGPATGFAELLKAELTAHGIEPKVPRVILEGPHVELPPGSLQTLALGVHELTTNALKHGAFATPAGDLSVRWSIETKEEQSFLTLEWRERGVAMAAGRHVHHGFGLDLIERALPYQLGATTKMTFAPDGISCQLVLPLAS